MQLPAAPRAVKAIPRTEQSAPAATTEATVIAAPVETAIERDVTPGITPTPREEGLAASEFAQDAPPLKPVLTTLAQGSYPLKGGWRLVVAADAVELKPGKETGPRLASGVVELTSGAQRLLIAIVALDESAPEPEETVKEADATSAAEQTSEAV